jgi:predicted dehydrogenase
MSDKIRWGVLAASRIAGTMAVGLRELPDAELVAIGSRTQESADRFGDKYNVPRRYGSYAGLAADPDVDIIYVSSLHPWHAAATLLCLEAGKPVLCEKPFAMNAREARQMIDAARSRKLFLMEAMWTRFLPTMARVRELLAAGAIGEVRMLHVDFGFRAEWNPASRLLNPDLGGGGLLDVGCYATSFASMVLGRPERVLAAAHIGATGVDEQAAMIYGYDAGRLAVLSCAVQTSTYHEAAIFGTEGRIRINSPWWRGTQLTVSRNSQPDETPDLPMQGNGFCHEAAEAMACLRAGKTESAILPLDETLAVMETLDEVRRQVGLKYPME